MDRSSSSDSEIKSHRDVACLVWQGLEELLTSLDGAQQSGTRNEEPLISQHTTGPERATKALTLSSPRQLRCRVSACLLPNCNLSTHQQYKPRPSKQSRGRGTIGHPAGPAAKLLQSHARRALSSDGVDGFPDLPMEETPDPNMRSLFHFFFTESFDKLANLFRGPSVRNLRDLKESMLAAALSSESYCRSLILQAQTEQDLAAERHEESDQALTLHNDTLKAFRSQVASIHQHPYPLQIELALLVLCILIMYDTVHDMGEASKMHWLAMRDLVGMRGGMHSVTISLAYVIHADRNCAIRFGALPTYTNPLTPSLLTPIPAAESRRYGSRFRSMKDNSIGLDGSVVEYLMNVSGLLELWEEQRVHATIKQKRGSSSSLDYFHFTRDQIDERFAVLHAQWAPSEMPEKCLLWTSRIIEYPCTWNNYVKTITKDMCLRLATELQKHFAPEMAWQFDLDVYKWMLFTLSVSEPISEARPWALQCLREILMMKHGSAPWPRMWWADEQENLLCFTWSSSRYAGRFKNVCNELEQLACDAQS